MPGLVQPLALAAVLIAGMIIWLTLVAADDDRVLAQRLTELRLAALTIHAIDAAAASGQVEEAELATAASDLRQSIGAIDEVVGPAEAATIRSWSARLIIEAEDSLARAKLGHAGAPEAAELNQGAMSTDAMHHDAMDHDDLDPGAMGASAMGPEPAVSAHEHDQFASLDRELAGAVATAGNNAEAAGTTARAVSVISGLLTVLALVFAARTSLGRQHAAEIVTEKDRSAKRFEALIANSRDMVFLIDPHQQVTYASPNSSALFGASLPTNLNELVAALPEGWRNPTIKRVDVLEHDQVFGPVPVISHAGEHRQYEIRVLHLASDPTINGTVVTARDVTDEVLLRSRLEQRAMVDDLTQLGNRRALAPSLDEALRLCAPGEKSAALIMLDLDGFKRTNDTLGHAVGDQLLIAVAGRLRTEVGDDLLLTRLGGDEFAVVLDDVAGDREAMDLAERLRLSFSEPFRVDSWSLSCRASIGVAVSDTWVEPATLLARSDLAMYDAKHNGRNRCSLFAPEMEHAVSASDRIYQALADADYDQQFSLAYQPIFDIGSEAPASVEALLRWHHPELGFVSPADFIPIAERSGEIVPLGKWVLDAACTRAARWDDQLATADMSVSVNVSAIQLAEYGFVELVERTVRSHNLSPSRIVIEVTETALAEQTDTMVGPLRELQKLGFRVAMDDFGTGYSSLGQLRDLPVDILKIDKSLVDPLIESTSATDANAVIEAIVALGRALGLTIVAEGIEELHQLDQLRTLGVDCGQGFLMARPSPAETAELSFGRSWRATAAS